MLFKIFLWLTAAVAASGAKILRDDHPTENNIPTAVSVTIPDNNVSTDDGNKRPLIVNYVKETVLLANEEIEEMTPESEIYRVETTYGPVKGSLLKDSVIAYYDVPYGKIKDHFQAPSEPEAWTEVHHASEHKAICPQLKDNEVIGDLDCLTLSIFTPKQSNNASVLIYIHGGELMTGSGDPTIYSPDNLINKGIILVLPNYRLGPLGFLCVDDVTAPGNAGLKDLTLALQWTEKNIAAFGGDPSNVVVSGEGLSSALAGYLALSPMSSDYVSKVITESGSVLSQKAIDRDPLSTALKFANALKIDEEAKDITDIGNAEIIDLILSSKNIQFRPCIEKSSNSFMNATSWDILHSTDVKKPFLIGAENYAGLQEFLDFKSFTTENIKEMNEDFSYLLPEDLRFKRESDRTDAANSIKNQYFDQYNISLDKIEEFTLFFTDTLYLGPAIRTARHLLNAGATVYFYEFSFNGSLNRGSVNDVELVGAARGDIVGYLFTGDETLPSEGAEEEEIMVNLMTDLWVSFMNTGRPTSANIEWNELKISEENKEEWLSIDSKVSLEKGVHVNRLALWNRLYDQHFVDKNSGMAHIPGLSLLAIAVILLLSVSTADSVI